MELRLLGPLELVADTGFLDLGGPRQRIVLAMLALNTNRVVSVEQFMDAVWGIDRPSTARGQIQICISALRKQFAETGSATIETRSPGYLLLIPENLLDISRFTGLVATAREHSDQGDAARALEVLQSALDLWRGPALAGVDSDRVQREATLLEDRRQQAVEERIRLNLDLGRHEEIAGELRLLVKEYPLRERLHEFLMLALYRSGRQAEGLEVGRQARAMLVDEFGIEPGPDLRALEEAILNNDPSLTQTRVNQVQNRPTGIIEHSMIPHQLPASIADFTGRQSHITAIKSALLSADAPPSGDYGMRIVAISGKGGVGKSSLAVRAAQELGEHFPDGHLYVDFQSSPSEDDGARQLARFLRALGINGSAIPEDLQERMEMFRSRVAGKRVLVVLDDVRTEEQVLPLLPGSPTCSVIIASRMRLSGLAGAHLVDLEVFDTDQSVSMLSGIVGANRVAAESEAAAELVELCQGLPLAIRIAGARLASRPHWNIRDLVERMCDDTRRLDEFAHHRLELRSTIDSTYDTLDEQAKRLLCLFALLEAPDLPCWSAAALLDTDMSQAEELLGKLADAQVLDIVQYSDERLLRYRLHPLIRVYARERLLATYSPAEQQAALARVLGGWLALSEEAHRQEYGGDYTILHSGAPRWYPEVAIDDPLQWWETEHSRLVAAIRQAAAAELDDLCWDLALTAVTLFEGKGFFEDWLETSELAAGVVQRAGNRTGQAAMLYSLGTLRMCQKRLDQAEQSFSAALELFEVVGNRHGRALVLRNSAFVHRLRGDTRAMLAQYDEALEIMRAVGDRVAEAHILCSLAKIRIDDDDHDEARVMLDQALLICQQAPCLRVEAQVLCRFADLYLRADTVELARQTLHRALRIVRARGDQIGEAHALHLLGIARHREGRLETASTTLTHALTLAQQVCERWVEGSSYYELGTIALVSGTNDQAMTHLRRAQWIFAELRSALWHAKTLLLMAEIHATNGDREQARIEQERAFELLRSAESTEATRLLERLHLQRAVIEPGE